MTLVKHRNRFLLAAAFVVVLLLAMRGCNAIALSTEFTDADLTLGERSIQIRPVAEVDAAGSRFGLRRYEMKDTFFVNVVYECRSKVDGEIEIIKDGNSVPSSEVYPSGRRCYMNFRTDAPMTGEFKIKIRADGGVHEGSVLMKRKETFSSPLLDMIGSA
jgi:hypothetical protein